MVDILLDGGSHSETYISYGGYFTRWWEPQRNLHFIWWIFYSMVGATAKLTFHMVDILLDGGSHSETYIS